MATGKRPRTKDDDEDEKDSEMTLNRYRHFVPGYDHAVPPGQIKAQRFVSKDSRFNTSNEGQVNFFDSAVRGLRSARRILSSSGSRYYHR